jgi:hypothetical protein
MRSRTIRAASRLGFTSGVAAGVLFAATHAHAGDVETGSASLASPNTSLGSASLRYEHRSGLPTSIQTGYHGPSWAKVNVGITIDPVSSTEPLFTVDMSTGALLQASWGADKRVVIRPQRGHPSDARVAVHHTLTPSIEFQLLPKLGGNILNASFKFDGSELVNRLPGARFDYDSFAEERFAPWGFAPVNTLLRGPDRDRAVLFSLEMRELADFAAQNIDGRFGVRATTTPTFSYTTTRVSFAGGEGDLSSDTGEASIPAVDGD